MEHFIDMLKQRLGLAQQRLQEKQQKLQIAQAEHQAVMQELASLQTLIHLEVNRDQQKAATQARPVAIPIPPAPAPAVGSPAANRIVTYTVNPAIPANATTAQPISASGSGESELTKTQIVREVLRKHTNGISPGQVWLLVRDHIDRPYVYSVLKRMKDRGEAAERGGRYYLQVGNQEEGKALQ